MRPIPASGRLWPRNVCMSMLSNLGAGGVQGAMEVGWGPGRYGGRSMSDGAIGPGRRLLQQDGGIWYAYNL